VKRRKILALTIIGPLFLGACTNPYDPVQRAFTGGLIGAGAGAAAGGMAAGAIGLGIGAGVGAVLGAVGAAVSTPPAPQFVRG